MSRARAANGRRSPDARRLSGDARRLLQRDPTSSGKNIAKREVVPAVSVSSPHISPIKRPPLTDDIIERLLGFIIDEGLGPGDKLPSERELIARLAVGRSSLRESIQALRAVGVLDVYHGEGTFVGSGSTSILTLPLAWGLLLNEDSATQVIEARRVVEVELAGLAAERASSQHIQEIGSYVDWVAGRSIDRTVAIQRDLEFHLAIARAGRNDILFHVLHTLQNPVRSWMNQVYGEDDRVPRWLEPHRRIYEAIKSRDPAAARQRMLEHLEPTEQDWLRSVRKGPEVATPR